MKMNAVEKIANFPKSSGSKYLAMIGSSINGIALFRMLEEK